MERNPEKETQGTNYPETIIFNLPALRDMARELRKDHQLSSKAIARILHLDINEAEEILECTNSK